MEPASVRTVPHALILKITLATLVANRAIKRMVGQQKLHDTFSRLVRERAVRLDHHSRLHGPRTRCHRLWRSLNLDQAHPAVASNHELFMVAVAGDGDASFLAGLDQGGAGFDGDFLALRSSHCISMYPTANVETGVSDMRTSTVSSTSACLRPLVANVRPLSLSCRADRPSGRNICDRIILPPQRQCWRGHKEESGEASAEMVVGGESIHMRVPAWTELCGSVRRRRLARAHSRQNINCQRRGFSVSLLLNNSFQRHLL